MMIGKVAIIVVCPFFLASVPDVTSYYTGSLNYTRQKRDSEIIECTLPSHPENGKWKLVRETGTNVQPGDKIVESSVIKFECNAGYGLSTNSKYLTCDENWEFWTIPECDKLCPPLESSTIYELKCTSKHGIKVKCNKATEGTQVEYSCAEFYETPSTFRKAFLCKGQKWSQKPVCLPVCGRKIVDDTKTLSYGSKPNDKLEHPWVTAIYQKSNDSYEYICGGSILSETVVLTAAHCVTNDYGDVWPKENYLVGAGKLYRKYQAPEDTRAQYRKLFQIVVPKDYKADHKRYWSDIAVLVVDEEFVLNEVIQPVCFYNLKDIYLHPGNIGEVSGWGLMEGEVLSDVLRTLKIPYKYETTCAAELPREWANRYYFEDKICAGYYNQSISVCDGDSGSGFVFKNPEDNRYYIHGTVSLSYKKELHCDAQQNSLYTKVAYHYDFVDRLLAKYNPIVRDCKLPPFPKNGKWTGDRPGLKPGDFVPSSDILKVECNKGFKPSTSNISIECGSATYMPTCQLLCPELYFPKGTIYYCKGADRQDVDCSETVEESIVFYFCPSVCVDVSVTRQKRCTNGSWTFSQRGCIPSPENCGQALNNEGTGSSNYPWTAGLYRRTDNNDDDESNDNEKDYKYICGGTIISDQFVLTVSVFQRVAASCFVDQSGKVSRTARNYLVGTGKIRSKYDSRDTHAQYHTPYDIFIHQTYEKASVNAFDIALLYLISSFHFDAFVQPICLSDVINIRPGDKGLISGWKVAEYDTSNDVDTIEATIQEDEFSKYLYPPPKATAALGNGSICLQREDNGKGFIRKNPQDNKYYLYGLISLDTDRRGCNSSGFWITRMSYDFVVCEMSKQVNL